MNFDFEKLKDGIQFGLIIGVIMMFLACVIVRMAWKDDDGK